MQRRPCFQRPIYVEIMENEENGEFFVVPLETKGRGTPMVNAQFCIRDTSDLIGRNNARGSTHREWRITCCDVGELCSQRVRSPRNASSSLPFWPSSRQQGRRKEIGQRFPLLAPTFIRSWQKLKGEKERDVVICDENILFENKRKIRCLRCVF